MSSPAIRFGVFELRPDSNELFQGRLEDEAGATGGQVISLPYTADLAAAFREVLDIMRLRYLLVYEPADSTPGWHRLEVRLSPRIRADVRARPGYFLDRGKAPAIVAPRERLTSDSRGCPPSAYRIHPADLSPDPDLRRNPGSLGCN